MQEEAIVQFTGDFAFLSNTYPSPVLYNGVLHENVDQAFWAAKSLNATKHWEEIHANVLYELILQKFTANEELAAKLLDTYPAELINGLSWNDQPWGVCGGSGKNKLGLILMKVRDHLRHIVDQNEPAGTAVYSANLIIDKKIHKDCQMTGRQLQEKYGIKGRVMICTFCAVINHEYEFHLKISMPENPDMYPQAHPCFLRREHIPEPVHEEWIELTHDPDRIYGTYEYFDEETNICLSVRVLPPSEED